MLDTMVTLTITMLRYFQHLQSLFLLYKEAVPQGEAEAKDSHKKLSSPKQSLISEAGGRRKEEGGRRQLSAGRRTQEQNIRG